MTRWLALGTALLMAASLGAQIDCLGPNLLPNPGFETDTGLGGWTEREMRGGGVVSLDEVAVEGRQSLRLSVPVSGAVAGVQSPPVAVEEGAAYLVSISFRQTGFSQNGPDSYMGAGSAPYLYWLDANGNPIGRVPHLSRFPYGPSGWDLRDAIGIAPVGARFARVQVLAFNGSEQECGHNIPSTLWIDALQLRRYEPPPTPPEAMAPAERTVEGSESTSAMLTWFVAGAPFMQQGGAWSEVVTDPRAERGTALAARTPGERGLMAHGPYYPFQPAGLGIYRLIVRAVVPVGAGEVGQVDVTSERDGTRLLIPIRSRPGTDGYTTCQGDFVLRSNGWWCVRIFTEGTVPWRIDQVRIVPVLALTDRQLLDLFPGSGATLPDDLRPARFRQVIGGPHLKENFNHTLLVGGVGFDRLGLEEAIRLLQRDSRCDQAWALRVSRTTLVEGLPTDPADLFRYSVVILVNVPANSIPLRHKQALHAFVERGGGLLVCGGHQGFERGAWHGSLLEETFPVVSGSRLAGGLTNLAEGARLTVTDDADGLLSEFGGGPLPWVRYLHRVTLRDGARVFVSAGGHPFAVGGTSGGGRVVCVLGWPAGVLPDGRQGFWEWPELPLLMRDLIWWSVGYADQTPAEVISD